MVRLAALVKDVSLTPDFFDWGYKIAESVNAL